MKKWLKNLSGAVMASLLAITLSGKAYANEQQELSVDAPNEIVEHSGSESVSAHAPEPASDAVCEATVLEEAVVSVEKVSVVIESPIDAEISTAEAPADETAFAVTEAPTAMIEPPEIVDVPIAEAPVEEKASVAAEVPTALTEVPEVVNIPNAKPPVEIQEAPSAASEMISDEVPLEVEMLAIETADESPAELPSAVLVDMSTEQKAQSVESETSADLEGAQSFDDELLKENDEQPVGEEAELDVSLPVLQKPADIKELVQTKETISIDDEAAVSFDPLSSPVALKMKTSLKENGEEQPEEQPMEIVNGEKMAKEPVRGGSKDPVENAAPGKNSIRQMDDGSYVLVNYSGTDSLIADGDITVLAAGLNRISSISGSGSIKIAGTGILLVDNLQGNLNLLTFTDIYKEGSVAVFVKQKDGTYLLKNGSVPGILDEQYEVKDATLVMPENTSILLCGTGAVPKRDGGDILYYHGNDVEGTKVKGIEVVIPDAIESAGKLTIAQQAALIVKKGASIILENLKSLGGTDSHDGTRHPELVVDGGTLTVNGTVGNGGGDVTLSSENQALFGEGNISVCEITAYNPAAINGSQVKLSTPELTLFGSGTVENLNIHNTAVYPKSKDLTISGLVCSGDSMVVLPGGSSLNIGKVEGTLSLKADGAGDFTVTGDMAGSGTINFESGIYALQEGTKLNNVIVSNDSMGTLFDYAGELNKSFVPLHIGPTEVKTPGQNSGVVPVAAAALSYDEDSLREYTVFAEKSITAVKADDGSWVLKQEDIQSLIDEYRNTNNCDWGVDVQILHLNQNVLNVSTYSMVTPGQNSSSSITIPAEDVCLIRILFLKQAQRVAPDSPGTQTGTLFTGSGILGGSGAGSVTIGNLTIIHNSEPEPEPEPQPEPEPEPQPEPEPEPEPEPQPEPEPEPQPEPEPEPLVAYIEEAPEEVPLVWAKLAPTVNADKATSAETQYVLLALEGEKTLEDLGGKATVSMEYTPPEEYFGKMLYVVFRNKDGSLTAIPATYSKGLLHFITDRLGTFMIVGLDFDITDIPEGEDFPVEFYEALARLPELKKLVFTEVGVI